ncbi:MAG: agmatine deiminase family protein [Patescibacteria group bacterium]
METVFTMPAEWEKHRAVWLAWPEDTITFPERIEKARDAVIEIIRHAAESETVKLLVRDEAARKDIESRLHAHSVNQTQVLFYMADYADVWLRDYGPFFVRDMKGKLSWLKWRYNAYGFKFGDLLKDDVVFRTLSSVIKEPMVDVPLYMEGGALESNGMGTLITTKQCLLNENRNPELSQTQIESILAKYCGAKRIVWLDEGIINDHTDGHVDDIARFTDKQTILCAYEEDESDLNFNILQKNYEDLLKARDYDGKPFTVVKIPMPHVIYDDGTKAPASYVNFYIANEKVLVPLFNDPNDERALAVISSLFPDRACVGIDCSDIIYGGGAIHCMTREEPVITRQ